MVLYCAADLLWATRIKSTADALGVPCRPARNEQMLRDRLGDSPVRALIVDLESADGPGLIGVVRSLTPPGSVRVVAFGPHDATEALMDARAAGADSVMTRGAFSARLADLIRDLGGQS